MPHTNTPLPFREALAIALKTERDNCGGALGLSEEISRANGGGVDLRVDRRKLSELIEAHDVKLSFYELAALDVYLSQRGRGLITLLQKPSLLTPLANSGRIAFMLGAKPQPPPHETTVMSRWDVLALSNLQRSLDRVTSGVHFEIEEVLLRDELDERARILGSFGQDRWYELIKDPNGPSVVCLGSPRACHAAEYLLCTMFGVPPFRTPTSDTVKSLPFQFVEGTHVDLPSGLAARSPIVSTKQPNGEKTHTYVGLKVDREYYDLTVSGYGLLAVQRRRNGKIWLVIAGLTGPATYATARILETQAIELPKPIRGEHSDVLWCVVNAVIETRQVGRGDNREVVSQNVVGSIRSWSPRQPENIAQTGT